MDNLLFFDANASLPPLRAAIERFAVVVEQPGNPSSPHALGRASRRLLDQARREVAACLGGEEKEVVFTAGASEGNRWLVDALCEQARLGERQLKVLASPLEHPSLRRPLEAAARAGLLAVQFGDVRDNGQLVFAPGALEAADAVFVTAAHNETGLLPDLDGVAARLSAQCVLCSDASQAVGRIGRLPARVDAIVASAHKMGGITGAGALLLRARARALPLPWAGGGQEGGRRPGTEALALWAAFGAAAAQVETTRAEHAALAALRDSLETQVLQCWPGARVVCADAPRLPQTSAITLPAPDAEALRLAMDLAGICVGFGSACSALAPEASPALLALGLDEDAARRTVRFSFSPTTAPAEVEEVGQRLASLRARLEGTRA